jgi:hypothetical protein
MQHSSRVVGPVADMSESRVFSTFSEFATLKKLDDFEKGLVGERKEMTENE